MTVTAQRQSPMQQAGIEPARLDREELSIHEPGQTVLLRAQRFDRFVGAGTTTGLPARTGEVLGSDPALLCLAPGEWLGVASAATADALHRQMTAGMAGAGLVRDISDGSLLLRLSGPAAPWLLAKLGSLDFLHGARQGAHCARTRLVDLAAIVYFHPAGDAGDVFDLIVDRSYAACLWALLQAAAPHAIELTTAPGNRV